MGSDHLLDITLGQILYVMAYQGRFFGLAILPIVILVEASIMYILHWGSVRRSLADSILANLPTTAIGFAWGVISYWMLLETLSYAAIFWGVACLTSIIIEGGILRLIRGNDAKNIKVVIPMANLVSYVVLAIFWWVSFRILGLFQ